MKRDVGLTRADVEVEPRSGDLRGVEDLLQYIVGEYLFRYMQQMDEEICKGDG